MASWAIPKEIAISGPRGLLIQSEVQRDLRRQRARGDIVRPAERGEEVVERVLIGDVDRGQIEVCLEVLLVEDVVLADGDVEQTAWRNALWIVVVVAGVGSGNVDQIRGELDWLGRRQEGPGLAWP